ncbi:hypothetical protein DY245_18525 [Streptomyces inhibens]|uniref:Uncharacterized protein n=1 Tax=Streptomyces inhibens TaxID=2293571 RepID=A0A371Q2B3_STRIH|nr:hypothetical protein [Streptomyces inhibens]REK88875.1 hypothetical protein DY245_18525 [Streptomyces inhibens]
MVDAPETAKATRIDRFGPTPTNDADGPTPTTNADELTPTASRPRPRALLPVAGSVLVLVLVCIVIGLLVKWPFGETSDAEAACDEAFQAIEAFNRSHPSVDEDSSVALAVKTAADQMAKDVHAAAAKSTEVNVKITLDNYATATEASHGGTSARDSFYASVVRACKEAGSAPSS